MFNNKSAAACGIRKTKSAVVNNKLITKWLYTVISSASTKELGNLMLSPLLASVSLLYDLVALY